MPIVIPDPVSIVYKTVDAVPISLDVYANSQAGQEKRRPAVVFFHGGGLVGSPSSHSRFLVHMVCALTITHIRWPSTESSYLHT
jgi:acetyl esterase/lipase